MEKHMKEARMPIWNAKRVLDGTPKFTRLSAFMVIYLDTCTDKL